MKIIGWIIVALLIIGAAVIVFSPKPPEDVQQAGLQDVETTDTQDETRPADGEEPNGPTIEARATTVPITFSFVGYGPGKSHDGTFQEFDVFNVETDENGVPTAGTVVFKTASIKTDTDLLNTHLCEKENFLNCAAYPEITFNLTNVEKTGDTAYNVTGNLTVKGITKQINFPVEAETATDFSSEFRVDMSQFDFSAPGIVNDEVLVRFSGSLI